MVIFGVIAILAKPAVVLADCYCDTVTNPATGEKSCQLRASSSCDPGETPVCRYNADGACNHGLFDGGSCLCTNSAQQANLNARDEKEVFCTQQGHGPDSTDPWINTAIGCVPVKIGPLVTWLLPYLFGIAGGISFLLMVYGFILMSTSGGDPKAVAGAKETITSAITGLLVAIFSLFILRLIAIDILEIPGLS